MGLNLRTSLLVCALASVLFAQGCERLSPDEMLSRAESSLSKGEYRAALVDLKALLQRDSDNAKARWLLAEVYLGVSDGASAEKELRRARELGVADDAVLPALAQALHIQDRHEDVLQIAYSGGLPARAAGEIAAFHVISYLKTGEGERAKAALEDAQRLAANSVEVRLAAAMVLVADEALDAATSAAEALTRDAPEFAEGWSLLGNIHGARKAFDSAEDAYTRALQLRANSVQDYSKRGMARLIQNKLDLVKEDAAALRAAAPKYYFGYYLEGVIAAREQRFADAQTALTKSLELAPQHFATLFFLASVEAQLGDSLRARQLAEQAVAMVPGHIEARKLLALWRLRDGKHREAESLVAPIVTARSEDLEAKRILATALLAQGKASQATELFQQLAEANHDDAGAQLRAGLSALTVGDLGAGLSSLNSAIALAPESAEINQALVGAYIRAQSAEDAVGAARRFAAQRPDDPVALNLLAAALVATGDLPAGQDIYVDVLRRDAGNATATRALSLLALASGDTGKAHQYLDQALARGPGELDLLLLKARAAGIDGDMPSVDRVLDRAIESHPAALVPRVLRAKRLLEDDAPEQALLLLSDFADSTDPQVLSIRAEAYSRQGRLSDARAQLERVPAGPEHIDIQWQLARIYAEQGDKNALMRALNRIESLAPEDGKLNLAKARMMVLEGRPVDAERVLEGIGLPAQDPDLLATRVAIARAKGDSGNYIAYGRVLFDVSPTTRNAISLSRAYRSALLTQEAEMTLAAWLAEHPSDVIAMLEHAGLLEAIGKVTEATSTLRRVLDLDGRNVFALNNLAWMLRQRSPAEALPLAKRAHELAPDSLEVRVTYASVLSENQQHAAARDMIESAFTRASDPALIRLHRAEIRYASGDIAGAMLDLDNVLKGDATEEQRSRASMLKQIIER